MGLGDTTAEPLPAAASDGDTGEGEEFEVGGEEVTGGGPAPAGWPAEAMAEDRN